MTDANAIRAGQTFRWVGLPGQYDSESTITVASMTATCQVNAHIDTPDGDRALITIGAADLIAAVDAGWLVATEQVDDA